MRMKARGATRATRPAADEDYFERKARDLVVPDDEIEAWELDAQEIDSLGAGNHGGANGTD